MPASTVPCTSLPLLALGKPRRLLNALYARVAADPARQLHVYTALSLDPPRGRSDLERRFLDPLVARLYGDDFPRLAYVAAQKRDALPAHVEVEEFYLQSGALLGSTQAQRRYASLNYTHVARALADRGVNLVLQKVASNADGTRLSLSSNTDLTFDTLDAIAAAPAGRCWSPRWTTLRHGSTGGRWSMPTGSTWWCNPRAPHPPLFALPREPVGDVEHAIGLYASALVRDGGTLQIGIGALADALCHALVLRHTDNAGYRRVLERSVRASPTIRRSSPVVASGRSSTGCTAAAR